MDTSGKNRIRKYFSSSSKKDEKFVAASYFNHDNENDLKEIARGHWDESPSEKIDLQHVLNRVHFHINVNGRKQNLLTRILTSYSRVAAILLIPILIGGLYFAMSTISVIDTYSEIRAPKGSRVHFVLPDGSKGFLNGGSVLKYQTRFNNKRTVNLNGEGYFDVEKDKRHPFIVETKFADIQVVGTKFDVCAYDSDDELFTTLEEGSVNVFNKIINKNVVLNPGEQIRVNAHTGKMESLKVDTELYTSWKEEVLRFNNAPFVEVVRKMERWYGVKIILDESLEYSESYTLTIKTESLKELLELLSITTPISYEINTDTIYIDSPIMN